MTVLVLSEHDVRDLLDIASCIEVIDAALRDLADGKVHNPLRSVVRPPADTLFGLMPAYRGGAAPAYGLKEIVIAPGNPERGLDAHQGSVLVHDGVTGELRAVLNGSAITAVRTAAVSAVATRALARRDVARVAIIGAGVQAAAHVEAMRAVAPEAAIVIHSRTPAHAAALAERAGAAVARSLAEACDGADVICTTTSSKAPVLTADLLAAGVHVNAVGSSVPSARELDGRAIAAAALFVDRRESTVNESGDYLGALADGLIGPDHIVAELGEVLTGRHPGRAGDDQITVFKSLGLAVEDLAAAQWCIERARTTGRGVEVPW